MRWWTARGIRELRLWDASGLDATFQDLAARAGLERSKATADEVLEYREQFEETLVFGEYAVEWGWISGMERPRGGGEVRRSRYHVMRILRRQPDGSWRAHPSIFCEAGG